MSWLEWLSVRIVYISVTPQQIKKMFSVLLQWLSELQA